MAADEGASTRERLLAAALAVLAEKGFDQARVAEIARRAGLTTGAIYANFGSKAELLAAAINAQQRDVLHQALGPKGKARIAERGVAKTIAHTMTLPAEDQHRRVLDLLAAAARDESVRAIVVEQASARAAALRALLDGGTERGLVDADLDADAVGAFIQMLGFGSIVSQGLGIDLPSTAKLAALLDRLLSPRS